MTELLEILKAEYDKKIGVVKKIESGVRELVTKYKIMEKLLEEKEGELYERKETERKKIESGVRELVAKYKRMEKLLEEKEGELFERKEKERKLDESKKTLEKASQEAARQLEVRCETLTTSNKEKGKLLSEQEHEIDEYKENILTLQKSISFFAGENTKLRNKLKVETPVEIPVSPVSQKSKESTPEKHIATQHKKNLTLKTLKRKSVAVVRPQLEVSIISISKLRSYKIWLAVKKTQSP